jgi:hypothetical protein
MWRLSTPWAISTGTGLMPEAVRPLEGQRQMPLGKPALARYRFAVVDHSGSTADLNTFCARSRDAPPAIRLCELPGGTGNFAITAWSAEHARCYFGR